MGITNTDKRNKYGKTVKTHNSVIIHIFVIQFYKYEKNIHNSTVY